MAMHETHRLKSPQIAFDIMPNPVEPDIDSVCHEETILAMYTHL
jgi:hypothetical protein